MFAYKLYVVGSIAPPGTAWGAESLRGNEANENKLMVLDPAQTRKGQSRRVLHNGTLPEVCAAPLAASYPPLETSRAHC